MLTRELAIADYERGQVNPDRLTTKKHSHYAEYARRMCAIYESGVGQTRRVLHQQIHQVFADEPDCPTRRIDAFCKLLDEVSEYQRDASGKFAKLRRNVFQAAAKLHPLVRQPDVLFENQEQYAKSKIASMLGQEWSAIDRQLFGDLMEFHPLLKFNGFLEPARLLARYNTAQAQAVLYDAVSMTVWATESYKSILRYAKLARLMHRIDRWREGYRFVFDGPASLFHGTHRYGVAMAKFLPSLLSCSNWRMRAMLKPNRFQWQIPFELNSQCGLTSDTKVEGTFDSAVESKFADQWGMEPRDGWTMSRETEILHHGQTCFLPDFVFRHRDGRCVLMEIVGFWTPEYLQHKQKVLAEFANHQIILAIPKSTAEMTSIVSKRTIVYKTAIKVNDVVERLKIETPCSLNGRIT